VNGAVYLYFGGSGDRKLTKGSFDDLRKLGITPKEGARLTFYDLDTDEEGHSMHMCAEGVLHFDEESSSWQVIVEEESLRWVPRLEVAQ
jgi:hypothetical protein